MKRNNALCFCTNKTKEVYKQLAQGPDIEISALAADMTWLRIRGQIAFDETREAKTQVFAEAPDLVSKQTAHPSPVAKLGIQNRIKCPAASCEAS